MKNPISYSYWNSDGQYGLWFRVFDYGLNINNMPLTFSQRNKLGNKFVKFGNLKISLLKP